MGLYQQALAKQANYLTERTRRVHSQQQQQDGAKVHWDSQDSWCSSAIQDSRELKSATLKLFVIWFHWRIQFIWNLQQQDYGKCRTFVDGSPSIVSPVPSKRLRRRSMSGCFHGINIKSHHHWMIVVSYQSLNDSGHLSVAELLWCQTRGRKMENGWLPPLIRYRQRMDSSEWNISMFIHWLVVHSQEL